MEGVVDIDQAHGGTTSADYDNSTVKDDEQPPVTPSKKQRHLRWTKYWSPKKGRSFWSNGRTTILIPPLLILMMRQTQTHWASVTVTTSQ